MIIDTMVIAYALLGLPDYGEQSLNALRKADSLFAPASIEGELLNVLWKWNQRGLSNQAAEIVFDQFCRIWDELIPVQSLWATALQLAFAFDHSPYDTLFIAAAKSKKTKVLTYDRALLAKFPGDTLAVSSFH